MKKIDLEKENASLKKKNGIYRMLLIEIRQNARECVHQKSVINNIWAIEKVTDAIARADCI